jgi:hypothetical protein
MPLIDTSEQQENKKVGFKITNYIEYNVVPISILAFILCIAYSSVVSYLAYFITSFMEKRRVS